MSADPVDVLVVGAGPAGLALALQARRHGARVRVVERRRTAFRPSRAMILHPSTLEGLRPLGVTDHLLARAATSPDVSVFLGSRELVLELDSVGLAGRRFPRPVLVRQSDVEAVLAVALADHGVDVERGVEFGDLDQGPRSVTARLRSGDGRTEEVECRYLVGCDGVNSTVRRLSSIGCSGGAYRSEVVLADVELSGRGAMPASARALVGAAGLVFLFPLGEQATWRLLATRPARPGGAPVGAFGPPVATDELQQLLSDAAWALTITQAPWSTRIRLPHQLADRFRANRVFLAGDAAHAHSPAGGQGMNTGIQDALNLGWKLALAGEAGPAHDELLASYDQERRPVAARLLRLTRMLFWVEAGPGPLARLLRGRLAPLAAPLLPWALRRRSLGSAAVWLLAQFWVHYRRSPLSTDLRPKRGAPPAGHRLPDRQVECSGDQVWLHDLTAPPGLHVLLARDAEDFRSIPARSWIHVHRLSSWPGTGVAVVRPDGYVGLSGSANAADVSAWLARVGP